MKNSSKHLPKNFRSVAGTPLAVRFLGTGRRFATRFFAGIHDTVLNVTGARAGKSTVAGD